MRARGSTCFRAQKTAKGDSHFVTTRKDLTLARVQRILGRFRHASIMVVGDLILDEFIWGQVSRISPEAPVPVVDVRSKTLMPGGAANVSVNIHALGARVLSVGIVGADREGETLTSIMGSKGMEVSGLVVDPSQPTTLKTRIIAHSQQVVRVDHEGTHRISSQARKRMVEVVHSQLGACQAVIIEDYAKGVIDGPMVGEITALARRHGKPVFVDPKKGHILDYTGVTMMTPNLAEARSAAGIDTDEKMDVEKLGQILMRKWALPSLLITLGEDGMMLFEKGRPPHLIPTVAREIFDVSGAGDTVIGSLTTAFVSGATMREAAVIANHAAGIVVGKLGTASTDCAEIIDSFRRQA